MILSGFEIEKRAKSGEISISSFNPEHVTTNSYDLTLGPSLIRYTEVILDPRRPNAHEVIKIEENVGYTMEPGDFVLGHSAERVGSVRYVPLIHGRSSTARIGLFVHVTADLIDIGSIGQVTFQLYATRRIRIVPGTKIGQVSFWVPKGEIKLYDGKYQGSVGPMVSKTYLDFWEAAK